MSNVEERVLTRQGLDRKAELLEHAERLFEERGFADTRMVDIARAAGVAKGLVYWYFESKEALFLDIILDVRARLRRAQVEATAAVDDPLEKIYVGMVASVEFVARNASLYGLMQQGASNPQFSSAQAESSRVHAGDTAAIIAEGQRLGVIRDDESPEALAVGNAGLVGSFVSSIVSGLLPGTPAEAGHRAARYAIRAIAASEAEAERVIAAHSST